MAKIRFSMLLLAIGIATAAGTAARGDPPKNGADRSDGKCKNCPTLFHIRRTTNVNELDYRARFFDCRWDQREPIHPRWRMLKNGPNEEEDLDESGPLKFLKAEQKKYYGVVLRPDPSPRMVKFSIKYMPKVEISAILSFAGGRCSSAARATIRGKEATLVLIYIDPDSGYISLNGCDDEGTLVRESLGSAQSSEAVKKAAALEKATIEASTICPLRPR